MSVRQQRGSATATMHHSCCRMCPRPPPPTQHQPPVTSFALSHSNLPSLMSSSSSSHLPLTRHPSLMPPAAAEYLHAAFPFDHVEPFPHAMTEWRESPAFSPAFSCGCLSYHHNNNNPGLLHGGRHHLADLDHLHHQQQRLLHHGGVGHGHHRHHGVQQAPPLPPPRGHPPPHPAAPSTSQSRLARRRHRNRTLTDEASAEYRKRAAQMLTARSASIAPVAPRKQVNISPTHEHGSSDNNGSGSSSGDSGIHLSASAGSSSNTSQNGGGSSTTVRNSSSAKSATISSRVALPFMSAKDGGGGGGAAPTRSGHTSLPFLRSPSKRQLPSLPPPPPTEKMGSMTLLPSSSIIKSSSPPPPLSSKPSGNSTANRLASLLRSVRLNRSKDKSESFSRLTSHHKSRRQQLERQQRGGQFGANLDELVARREHCSIVDQVPDVVVRCARFVEEHAITDGIYRVSGVASNIKRLRSRFIDDDDNDQRASESLYDEPWIVQDPHCVPALLKQFFRELPRPLISEDSSSPSAGSVCFPLLREAMAVRESNSDSRVALDHFRKALYKLSSGHYRTLHYLMLHLHRVASHSPKTGMTAKNLAIVWAPNLIRGAGTDPPQPSLPTSTSQNKTDQSKDGAASSSSPMMMMSVEKLAVARASLQLNLVHNTQIVQYLIDNAKWLFEGGSDADDDDDDDDDEEEGETVAAKAAEDDDDDDSDGDDVEVKKINSGKEVKIGQQQQHSSDKRGGQGHRLLQLRPPPPPPPTVSALKPSPPSKSCTPNTKPSGNSISARFFREKMMRQQKEPQPMAATAAPPSATTTTVLPPFSAYPSSSHHPGGGGMGGFHGYHHYENHYPPPHHIHYHQGHHHAVARKTHSSLDLDTVGRMGSSWSMTPAHPHYRHQLLLHHRPRPAPPQPPGIDLHRGGAAKYHSLTSASAVSLHPGGGSARTATVSGLGRLTGRPRSIDADFILRMEQLGLSAHAHSMPYNNNTFSGKTAAG